MAQANQSITSKIVESLCRMEEFEAEVETWLANTRMPAAFIGRVAGEVDVVAQKFTDVCKRIQTLENAVGLAKLTGIPQV